MKKRIFLVYTVILLLVLSCGCAQKEVTLETLLPRAGVTESSVLFLNVGLGEDIPSLRYDAVAPECAQLCDLLYGAAQVTIEIPENYSPEANASHAIYLTTSAGTMTLYYDDYQNLINIPSNRKAGEENVRTYLSFQTAGLNELLTLWQEQLPEPEPEIPETPQEVQTEPFVAPDDTALWAGIDPSWLEQAGQSIAFEPAVYAGKVSVATYYVFGNHEKTELPANKVLVVAADAETANHPVKISNVAVNDNCVLITVEDNPDAAQKDTGFAVLLERKDIDLGKPVVFMDAAHQVLYVQQLAIPGEIPEPVTAAETGKKEETPKQPSTAAGGEEKDDGPLQP